jgi:hypothetical protein
MKTTTDQPMMTPRKRTRMKRRKTRRKKTKKREW